MSGEARPRALRGPEFGSFAADEVSWLLTDLSTAELEAPVEEREEAIQSGAAHYAESLPMEYQPSPEYQELFRQALARSASRVAHDVGVVAEQILAARGGRPVLVSLARAGTPVGVLLRRWLRQMHGLDVPHYAVSIVRGKGIDTVALRYLAAHHDPADVVFVDAWTGKGAITRELTQAIDQANPGLGLPAGRGFDPGMAVLADTGRCVRLFGSRDDYLIPSACLNATVHGLVSRTVVNQRYIGPADFHGAKFYSELAHADVSAQFLDEVSRCFGAVADGVAREVASRGGAEVAPTWSGWAAVEQISRQYGIDNINLVKPGVGETTRVLLRRVPWKVLVRPDAADDLAHVTLLAAERGVDVIEVENLAYSCIGLIHPGYTRSGPRVPAPAAVATGLPASVKATATVAAPVAATAATAATGGSA